MELFFGKALAETTATDLPVEAEPTWLQTAFGDLAEVAWWHWLILAVLLIGGLTAYRMVRGSRKTVWNAKMLSLGAVCIALSSVLSMVKLFEMPTGGSVTAASMLPLMLFAYVYGVGPGIVLGFVHGVLQYLMGGYFLSFIQVLVDYPIAFAVCGLAGAFRTMKNQKLGLTLGVVLGSFGRYAAAVAAGVFFWSEYAPEGMNPWVYSLGYNASYMIPECIICVILAVLMGSRLVREARKVK